MIVSEENNKNNNEEESNATITLMNPDINENPIWEN